MLAQQASQFMAIDVVGTKTYSLRRRIGTLLGDPLWRADNLQTNMPLELARTGATHRQEIFEINYCANGRVLCLDRPENTVVCLTGEKVVHRNVVFNWRTEIIMMIRITFLTNNHTICSIQSWAVVSFCVMRISFNAFFFF